MNFISDETMGLLWTIVRLSEQELHKMPVIQKMMDLKTFIFLLIKIPNNAQSFIVAFYKHLDYPLP